MKPLLSAMLLGVLGAGRATPAAEAVEPSPGDLKWACATVPTPQGDIEVDVEGGSVKLRVPMGTTAEYRGQVFAGPCSAKLELREQ